MKVSGSTLRRNPGLAEALGEAPASNGWPETDTSTEDGPKARRGADVSSQGMHQTLLDLQVPPEFLITAHEESVEKEFQAKAEKWLEHRGYLRRTKANIAGGVPPCGWQSHLPQAEGNPLVLDIILLRVDGRYLEIELKTETGRVLKHQRELCGMAGKLCRTMRELRDVVEEWERKKETGR